MEETVQMRGRNICFIFSELTKSIPYYHQILLLIEYSGDIFLFSLFSDKTKVKGWLITKEQLQKGAGHRF